MKLDNKKALASRTLNVGKERIAFNTEMLNEIKESLTKEDIRGLVKSKAIIVKEIKGRRKKAIRKTKRNQGSIKKRVNRRKKDYVLLTRKLRAYILELRKQNMLNKEEYLKLRKEIKAGFFRSKSHMKERINPDKK